MISKADDPTLLKSGDTAPYDGLLFSQEKAQHIKTQLIEVESLNKTIELYKSNEDLYNKKIDILQKQNDNLSTSLYEERSSSFWRNFTYFALGIVSVGIAGYAVHTLTK